MIGFGKNIFTKHCGVLQRRKVLLVESAMLAGPTISPGIQGNNAWKLLTAEQRGQVNTALTDAAVQLKCTRAELQWKIDKGGAIHVKKTPRIDVN